MMAPCSRPAKKVKGESRNGPNWLELPRNVTANILQRIDVVEIVTSASLVCPLWWNICKDPLMWRVFVMTNNHHSLNLNSRMKICRFASRRSCGLLEEINIEYFGTDDLLIYIANNSPGLRRMRFAKCRISDRGLCEAVKKFPLLEELDISLSYKKFTKASLEAIGWCCPLLKVLKFNKNCGAGAKDDDEAFAIAKTMSRLYHLEIIGNSLSNDGLLAILNGCPLLEVLDLRLCSNVKMSGGLREKYCQQIKILREPHDDLSCDHTLGMFFSMVGLMIEL